MSENASQDFQPITDAEWAEQMPYRHGEAPAPQAVAFGEPNGQSRPLSVIAEEIRRDWKRPYFGAVPYLSAMAELDSVEGKYYSDSAASVVRYFLANAGTWRGETARRVKAELNAMVKGKY